MLVKKVCSFASTSPIIIRILYNTAPPLLLALTQSSYLLVPMMRVLRLQHFNQGFNFSALFGAEHLGDISFTAEGAINISQVTSLYFRGIW